MQDTKHLHCDSCGTVTIQHITWAQPVNGAYQYECGNDDNGICGLTCWDDKPNPQETTNSKALVQALEIHQVHLDCIATCLDPEWNTDPTELHHHKAMLKMTAALITTLMGS